WPLPGKVLSVARKAIWSLRSTENWFHPAIDWEKAFGNPTSCECRYWSVRSAPLGESRYAATFRTCVSCSTDRGGGGGGADSRRAISSGDSSFRWPLVSLAPSGL